VTIDGVEFPKTLINITQLLLARRGDILIAGSDNTQKLTDNNMRNNFHGTIDKVRLSRDHRGGSGVKVKVEVTSQPVIEREIPLPKI